MRTQTPEQGCLLRCSRVAGGTRFSSDRFRLFPQWKGQSLHVPKGIVPEVGVIWGLGSLKTALKFWGRPFWVWEGDQAYVQSQDSAQGPGDRLHRLRGCSRDFRASARSSTRNRS